MNEKKSRLEIAFMKCVIIVTWFAGHLVCGARHGDVVCHFAWNAVCGGRLLEFATLGHGTFLCTFWCAKAECLQNIQYIIFKVRKIFMQRAKFLEKRND